MSYWTDIFTLETWSQAEAVSFGVSGFPAPTRGRGGYSEAMFNRIASGDIFLCYCKRPVQRWLGALRVLEGPFQSARPVWGFDKSGPARFPWRFEVEPVVALAPEYGLPGDVAARELMCLRKLGPKWGVYLQRSLNNVPEEDGTHLVELLQQPRPAREISIRQPKRATDRGLAAELEPNLIEAIAEAPVESIDPAPVVAADITRVHTEIQGKLRDIGKREGHDVWVADRGLSWQRGLLGDGCLESLPAVGPPESQRVMRNIDVIWFRRATAQPVALFEIENSTSVYSGLLRFNDVIIDYPITQAYIVADDGTRSKFQREIVRRTFAHSGLHDVTRFLTYEKVRELWERYQAVGPGADEWA
jgi:hypothetical protein